MCLLFYFTPEQIDKMIDKGLFLNLLIYRPEVSEEQKQKIKERRKKSSREWTESWAERFYGR